MRIPFTLAVFMLSTVVLCPACGESASGPPRQEAASGTTHQDAAEARAIADDAEQESADIRILFIGNSHTATHRMPETVRDMLEAGDHAVDAYTERSTGAGFLAGHATNPRTLQLIEDGPWDFVVLQAQKYSTSGRYTYPTDAAVELCALIKKQNAQPLMFPAWGQRGNTTDEAERIHALHEEIAAKTGAEIVPVGRAWDRVIAERDDLVLHAPDGNHASRMGAYLTACVFYSWFSERDARKIGDAAAPEGLAEDVRELLQRHAWETVRDHRDADDGE